MRFSTEIYLLSCSSAFAPQRDRCGRLHGSLPSDSHLSNATVPFLLESEDVWVAVLQETFLQWAAMRRVPKTCNVHAQWKDKSLYENWQWYLLVLLTQDQFLEETSTYSRSLHTYWGHLLVVQDQSLSFRQWLLRSFWPALPSYPKPCLSQGTINIYSYWDTPKGDDISRLGRAWVWEESQANGDASVSAYLVHSSWMFTGK